jgi:NAD(P)H-nitrite reductase large subunit
MDRQGAKNMAELYSLKLAHETVRVAVCSTMEDIMRSDDECMRCQALQPMLRIVYYYLMMRFMHYNKKIPFTDNPSHTFAPILKNWFLYYYDIYVVCWLFLLKIVGYMKHCDME